MLNISLLTRKPFGVTVCLLVACLHSTISVAREFATQDGAEEQQQTRRFDVSNPQVLLRACLAVIQDINFHVTESALQPGLVVAESPPPGLHTLTVSLLELPERTGGHRVRLSMSAGSTGHKIGKARPLEYTNFYQDFFKHLDRELFKERQIQ
jgi:hypothetical protein